MLYIECKMGVAGDMLMSALYELLDEDTKKVFLDKMNSIFPDAISVHPEKTNKLGIYGTHMHVHALGSEEGHEHDYEREHHQEHKHEHEHHQEYKHEHEREHHHEHEHTHAHHHYSYQDILVEIDKLDLPEQVKEDARVIYQMIGEAEAKVHNSSLENIHFHEVGSLDAIADVVGNALAIYYLNPDQIVASPIHVGNGMVKCAHGILPVPAPATAEILQGVPYYTGNIQSELCTPTGAAILKHFVTKFTSMPIMDISSTGIGLGYKDFEVANCVRVFNGKLFDESRINDDLNTNADHADQILDISCNLDDMTGEELGFAMDVLMDMGALDVYYTSIYMKKNRPGILLHVFCNPDEKDKFINAVLKHTTTRGVRYQYFDRVKLHSDFERVTIGEDVITQKISSGFGIKKEKLEFEDLKAYALSHDVSIFDARKHFLEKK